MSLDKQLKAEYQDKIVWITGVGQGIGLSTAKQFSALGAKVIGFDKHFSDASVLYKSVQCDLSNLLELEQILAELIASGLAPYNLINVAGVLEYDSIDAITTDQWLHCHTVNCSAVFLFLQACYNNFKQNKAGSIVTVGSNAAQTPRQKMAAYCASKAAVTQLTLNAGLELANYGIRCNVIAPGSTLTPMQTGMWQDDSGAKNVIDGFAKEYKLGIPLQKIATPDEVAHSIVFIASNLSSHTTMQIITIDGGATF
ncbi:2,3-dihydro-2,3-dihydroxybenzoate dehydrogenase [Pseudoalteromonas sp. MMG012]|uniref:2,3-dihydro-2,3-dihydroxybenzoate dehydrogenase n=1 Tax=Pseudoalteromonas sp. MMG012 TaxID=2822686 RepID=UPI001B3A67F0|nr:2,3-dihydro-2,3-dihydroxybenzoate dehydrogenase [Pseudoalteromonas sp. MMG012]MBQ4850745.1 2,3-dihydro-2,3-dihydroxybenzoate dehydrogenase [Pseudoalteromonas sp. MMG012]